jgi:hypothetical protein
MISIVTCLKLYSYFVCWNGVFFELIKCVHRVHTALFVLRTILTLECRVKHAQIQTPWSMDSKTLWSKVLSKLQGENFPGNSFNIWNGNAIVFQPRQFCVPVPNQDTDFHWQIRYFPIR